MRPLKDKLGAIHYKPLAIFAFLTKLDNSKHFEPYLFFDLFWPCGLYSLQRPKIMAFSSTTKHSPSHMLIIEKSNHPTIYALYGGGPIFSMRHQHKIFLCRIIYHSIGKKYAVLLFIKCQILKDISYLFRLL